MGKKNIAKAGSKDMSKEMPQSVGKEDRTEVSKEIPKEVPKDGNAETPEVSLSDPEAVPATDRMRIATGDILRMRRHNAYCKPGKYAILSLDTTVCLARTKKKAHHRRLTNDLVYFLITDLNHFQQTGKQFKPVLRRR